MISHNKSTLGKEEEHAALRVIRSNWLAPGKEVIAFENEVCFFLGLPDGYAVAVANGTSALFLALWVLQAGGKIIAFPVYVCSALRHAVKMVGGLELLLDISRGMPNINLKALQKSGAPISIIPHMFGLPLDLSKIEGIDVVEDCAQAIGASVNQIPVGLQGKIGIFSFYASKLMTSGGHGGMVVSQDKNLIDAIKDYRNFDCRKDKKRRFNFQMTDLQAAIGREQLKKLPSFLSRRAEIFDQYQAANLKCLDVTNQGEQHCSPVRYRAVMHTNHPQHLIEKLAANGVKTIVPVETWELLGEPASFPNAMRLTQETVSLPIYPSLNQDDVQKIISYLQ